MRWFLAAALLSAALPAAAKTPATQVALPGSLLINCPTEGAEVFIDGERKGTVPLPGPIPLPNGEHTIKVQKPGYAPLIDVFKITRKSQTKLDVELVPVSGAVKVTVNVEKARVFIDGKFVCEAPCTNELQVGARAIQVSKGGYKDYFQNVEAVAGQELALDVKLEELPPELNPYKPAPLPPAKWYEKWWVWTVAVGGAAVVAVAVGVGVSEGTKDPIASFCEGGAACPIPAPTAEPKPLPQGLSVRF
jgi:hypothetical protein